MIKQNTTLAGIEALIARGILGALPFLANYLPNAVPDKTRALSIDAIWGLVAEKMYATYPACYMQNLYAEDDEGLFAVVTMDKRLWRAAVTVAGNDVGIGELTEVVLQFQERTTTRVVRQPDGRVRLFSISCSSEVNKDGEIDSTLLFDKFVMRWADNQEPQPLRTFFHRGATFRLGVVDFIARDGFLLITSTLMDDTEIARAAIAAHEADPDYWGESIEYDPLGPASVIEFAGKRIPVFNDGIFRGVSMLPNDFACAYHTRTRSHKELFMNDVSFQAWVKVWGGDEAKARKWLEENAAEENRAIEAARASGKTTARAVTGQESATAPDATQTTPATTAAQTPAAEGGTQAPANVQVIEIGEADILRLAQAVKGQLLPEFSALLAQADEKHTKAMQGLDTRLTTAERVVAQRNAQLISPQTQLRIAETYRPRVANAPAQDQAADGSTEAQAVPILTPAAQSQLQSLKAQAPA